MCFFSVPHNLQITQQCFTSQSQLSDLAVSTLCAVLEENSQVKSLRFFPSSSSVLLTLNLQPLPSIENNRVSPDAVADLFESIASSNNGLLELRCAAQAQVKPQTGFMYNL